MAIIFLVFLLLLPSFIIYFGYSRISSGLLNLSNNGREDITIGSISLAIICIGFITIQLIDITGLATLVIFSLIPSVITAIGTGIWFEIKLQHKKLHTALIMSIGFPIFLSLVTLIGMYFSPDSIRNRNGEKIVMALQQYYSDKGVFPSTLQELEPAYIDKIIQPKTIWGWLYTVDGDIFSLGYVYDIGSMGYGVCYISNTNKDWECLLDYREPSPFKLQPTPVGYP